MSSPLTFFMVVLKFVIIASLQLHLLAQESVDYLGGADGKVFYRIFDENGMNWNQASERCISHGYTLASLKTREQSELIRDNLQSFGDETYWTGLRQSTYRTHFADMFVWNETGNKVDWHSADSWLNLQIQEDIVYCGLYYIHTSISISEFRVVKCSEQFNAVLCQQDLSHN